jgi:arylformamidase
MGGKMSAELGVRRISRRLMLGAAAAVVTGPALAEECRIGPAPHTKGPSVFLDYDQIELDAAYDQPLYEPNISQISKRLASNSETARDRLGAAQRVAYGEGDVEKLDLQGQAGERADLPIHPWRRMALR